jgi:hypothetical protein
VDLPLRDLEVDVVQRDDLAERLADAARANGRRPPADLAGRVR